MNLFNHHFVDVNGVRIYTERYRNQPFLLVNIATDSRFTPQLRQLQQLHSQLSRHGLVIVAMPCTDFGDESRDEEAIEAFLRENYPYSYIVTQRYEATGPQAHPLFKEMLQEKGSAVLPRASFHKYLFDRRGELAEHWNPEVLPDDPMFVRLVNQHLGGL